MEEKNMTYDEWLILNNKEETIKMIVKLSKEEIVELTNNLNNLVKMMNKSTDTLFLRYIGLRGYHTISDFWNKNGITRDSTLDHTIKNETDSLKAYFKLKDILDIDDETFDNFIKNKLENKGE